MSKQRWGWDIHGCTLCLPATCEHQKVIPIVTDDIKADHICGDLVPVCGGRHHQECPYRATNHFFLTINEGEGDKNDAP